MPDALCSQVAQQNTLSARFGRYGRHRRALVLSGRQCCPILLPVMTKAIKIRAKSPSTPNTTAPAMELSINDAVISAEISGVILEIPVQVGDQVTSGDLLVTIACDDYRREQAIAKAALDQAESKLRLYQSQMASAQALSKAKSISKDRLDERRANQSAGTAEVERLSAALRKADLRTEKCEVRAPFDGVVIGRLASIGELATPGTQLVRLLDSDNIEVQANIQESDLESLKYGTEVQFVTPKATYPLRLRKSATNRGHRDQKCRGAIRSG